MFGQESGKILVAALDHAVGWVGLTGIDRIQKTLEKIMEAGADAVIMMEETAQMVLFEVRGEKPFNGRKIPSQKFRDNEAYLHLVITAYSCFSLFKKTFIKLLEKKIPRDS